MAKSFSDYAYDKMVDLFHNHSHEVGSQLKKYTRTNTAHWNLQIVLLTRST